VNLAIISCHLYWLAPDVVRDQRFETPATAARANENGTRRLRIFFANVRADNYEHAALLHAIVEARPDVIVLVEFSHHWNMALRDTALIAEYPHGSGLNLAQANGVSILSKLPINSSKRECFAGRCIETSEVQIGSHSLYLVGLHAPRPMKYRDNDYEGFWKNAMPLLLSKPHPLVVVGDFNATQYSLVYQELKAGGLRSAHEDQGRGWATTWPNGRAWIPPIRIDQALLSADVECLGITEGTGFGSDHKPLILDIRHR
jgi:endonuclease/exonuclease/phosphatase (EEP) superfamily protein YafD